METYDVIVIGAGIAGTGLAYNLKKIGYKGSVLVIDKKEPGANAAYGYRNTFQEVIKEYNLPYEHVYKGVKVGTEDKIYFALNKNFYFVDYKKVCRKLLKGSEGEFKKEKAIGLDKNKLRTDKKEYFFNILVDASGKDFFVRKKINKPLPFRYWIGKTRILKNKLRDTNYFYYQFSDQGYQEDLYPLKNKTIQGDWQYTKKIDFKLIKPTKKTLYKKYICYPKKIDEKKEVIPATPVFPLTYKNILFLGDSFGNASTSSSEGLRNILDSSKILSEAIKKRDVEFFERCWKKKYFNTYLKFLAVKMNDYDNLGFFKKIKKMPKRSELLPTLKKYPVFFEKCLMCNPDIKIPLEMKKKYPKRTLIFKMYYYMLLKLRYGIMQFQ